MQLPPSFRNITLVRELRGSGADDRPFRRGVRVGQTVRIHRGAYMSHADWAQLDGEERHRHQALAAVAAGRARPTLSHHSAALLWGIPLLPPAPSLVHVLSSPATGTRTEGGFRRHATSQPDMAVSESHGVTLTNLERTLVDFARIVPFADAVVAFDWALRPATYTDPKPFTTPEAILDMADRLRVTKGRRRVERALEFADSRSGSAGESLSRVCMHEARLPAPELQVEFRDREGLIGYVDFYWPSHRLIGEFDGHGKYLREELRGGRSLEEVIMAEKRRENRLRACGPSVSRWEWKEARSPRALGVLLRDAGLR